MHTFIFQSVPQRYDLRHELQQGDVQTWYATRYTRLMQVNDTVLFWMGGAVTIRGLYGWGRLTGTAYEKPEWHSHGVDVRVEHRFRSPLLATRILATPGLDDLPIFRMAQATNFLLAPDEASRLASLIVAEGEVAPEPQTFVA